jgi:hypothetical protein
MKNSCLVLGILLLTAACSSTMSKVNQGSSDVARDSSIFESAAGSIERALATEKRIEEKMK